MKNKIVIYSNEKQKMKNIKNNLTTREDNPTINTKKNRTKCLIIVSLSIIFFTGILFSTIFIIKKRKTNVSKEQDSNQDINSNEESEPKNFDLDKEVESEEQEDLDDLDDFDNIEQDNEEIEIIDSTSKKLEVEYQFKTKVNDLKRINVHQKYYEDIIIDNKKTRIFLDRKTNYDIYIISEEDSKEEEKYYYNKIYTGAISIVSECFSRENETCVPLKLVDLTDNDNNNINSIEINDLKDIPLPLCLFNITDNDIITSITCHKSLEEHKKRMIVLDLYFFRPPAIKRINKKESNITLTKINLGKNKKLINEKNGGICDIENPYNSFCTTDMNITVDLDDNLLEYDEIAYMIVKNDENNSYEKNKITKLIDETYKISSFEPKNYEQILNKILTKLEPYFKNDELFSKEKFEEMYIASKQGVEYLREKLQFRKLNIDKKQVIMENNIFNYISNNGIEVNIGSIINSGLYSDYYYEANTKLKIENNKKNIITSKKSSLIFNKLINQLITLSEAGNNLIRELFQKTNNSLDSLTQEINETISNLNSLVKYKDFSEIFDSTLSLEKLRLLPITIFEETSNLKNKISQLLNEIENGDTKMNILNNNIYDYNRNSHNLIYELFGNLNNLSESLNSDKSKLTEISIYYLNHTFNSYIKIIKESENILNNYYKKEYNLIKPQVDLLVKNFETNLIECLQNESKIIDNLYKKIENKYFIIQNLTDEDYQRMINNLYYIKNAISEIINKIKDRISNEIDIKDSGYFISNNDINSNNNSFYNIIDKSLNIFNKLCINEDIDKSFDQVMINFRKNCANIIKDMDKQKEELFILNEDVLRESLFTKREENNIQQNISELGVDILNKIKNENNYYLTQRKETIDKFLKENKQYLYNLSSDLTILFSEESLKELSNLYEKAFNSCLNKINNELNQNELLSNEYFNNMEEIANNKAKIKELLQNTDDVHLLKKYKYLPLSKFEDSIISESITESYLTKYETFKNNFDKSKQYINNQLFKELLLEYKKPMTKIKEVLQNFKNNKLDNKYLDLDELSFIDNHIRNIDNLYNRVNNYISNNIYNSQYLRKIEEYKNNKTVQITKINENIEKKNKKIYKNNIVNDHINDFCITFLRKITYSCINGVWPVYINSDYFCFPLLNSSYNYMKLIEHSIDSDDNLKIFNQKFISFYSSIKEKVQFYTEKIEELKKSLSLLEEKTINQNITLNYLNEIKNEINSILTKSYGNEIIKSSYNYYKNNIEGIMENLLNNISIQWNEAYDLLYDELENNLYNFKNSINEFGVVATIYKSLILQNITKIYFDSIITHQKNEFNYTIKYYYNYLLKIVKSTHQSIINKIPINNVGFNNIIEQRKNEVNDLFNSLIQDIIKSENETLSENRIIYVLKVAKTNFFKINYILADNILQTNNSLSTRISNIFMIRNNKVNDEFSLSSRFYLENSISGEELEGFYEQINNKKFIYLDLEKFKELLIENWIFDGNELINKLNTILYNSNLEITQEFLTLKEDFIKQLENQISNFLTKEEIEKRITELYKSEIKELEITQIEEIKQNVMEILIKIKEHLLKESKRLNTTINLYNKNYTKIENRLNEYKNEIFNKLEITIFKIINDFYQNMINKVYTNYVEKCLNEYIKESKTFTSQYEEVKLLNSSYKIGEIIDNIIENFVNEYKNITQLKIGSKYNEYLKKIKNQVNLDDLKLLINNEITQEYNSILYPTLKEIEKYNTEENEYDEYDLNNEIITDIESTINIKINEIEKIMNITKGNNYQLNLNNWNIFDYTRINDNVLINIKNSFDKFIEAQKNNEENNFNNILQNIIKSNFNNLLNNIFPSFGKYFFERIIKYNENFKISSLYNNLQFSLAETLTYYLSLNNFNQIKRLTKDLKLKVLSLNNLDLTIENRNKQVINDLEIKIDEFIINSKEDIINHYKSMIETDTSIELNYNELIKKKIKENMNLIQQDIEKEYISVLTKYFKEELIPSYTNIMKTKTNEMIQTIKNDQEILKIDIEDIFIIEPDAVLNDINVKINNTLDSIEKFNLNTFKISDELINYLNSYGETKIQPFYKLFLNILNNETKNKLILNLEENFQNYEKYFSNRDFIEQSNNIYSLFYKNYIEKIKEYINDYGTTNYIDNLENEIYKLNENNKRNLEDILTDEEIKNQEKIADKSIDDTFKKLLTLSNNTKTYINTFEKFDDFDKLIIKYINKVNSSHKLSQKIILDNDYEENILKTLNQKLDYLKKMNLDYYKLINESYYKLKNYLIESIGDINNGLNECANITYSTFKDKYIKISKETESFDDEEFEIFEEINQDSYEIGMQNQITIVNYKISNMIKNIKIKYDLEFENVQIKKPNIKASIINQIKPKKINFDFIRTMNGCGKIIENVEVEFNDVNYTMNVDFNIQTKDTNFTTIINSESYQLSTEVYQIEEEIRSNCYSIQEVIICIHNTFCNEDDKKIISNKKSKIIPQNKIVYTIINK